MASQKMQLKNHLKKDRSNYFFSIKITSQLSTGENTYLIKMKPDYEFEPLGGSPRDGYNDPLKTMFGKKLQDNLAREAIQNSLDAVLDENKPVTVKFNLKRWVK